MKKIIIAGAGHGGLVAAKNLAEYGFDVTVYEKKAEEDLGYDQYDSVHLDGFEKSGVPIPEEYKVLRTGLAFIIPGTDIPPLKQGVKEGTYNVEIDRKALYRWLIAPAKEAGVKFCFGVSVEGPIVLGSRVAGLRTSEGDVYADLVIDASGIYSPVRMNLPESFSIQRDVAKFNVLHPYRAFFARNKDAGAPENVYTVSLLTTPFCGIMWAIVKEDEVDVLIASFENVTDDAVNEKLEQLKAITPQIGGFLRGGHLPDIPVRQPLSVMVADGYAAIGDAAFMTVPLKGSGVGHAMRAGKMLAEVVASDEKEFYNRETLWPYQVRYFEEIGFGSALMAVIKDELPALTEDSLDYAFRGDLLTSEILERFGSEAGVLSVLSTLKLSRLREMARKIVGHQELRRMLVRVGTNLGRCKLLERNLKDRYDAKSMARWVRAYDGFFVAVREEIEAEAEKIKASLAEAKEAAPEEETAPEAPAEASPEEAE